MNRKCEICGEPATYGVRDTQRRNNYISGYVERKPFGPAHFFCKKHYRKSKEIDVTISLTAQLKEN